MILWGLHVKYFYVAAVAGLVIGGMAILAQRSKRPTAVAVDVGHSAIKIVELSRGPTPTLLRYAITPTPAEAVTDGLVSNRDGLVDGLQNALKQSGIKPGEIVTVMTGQTLVLQHLDFPRMRESELRQAVADQITAHVPLPPEEILYDYQQAPSERDDLSRVLLVATQRDPVTALVETMREAGMAPTRVDIEPLAAYRAVFGRTSPNLASPSKAARGGRSTKSAEPMSDVPALAPVIRVIVDLGAGTSNVSIYRDGILQLQRVLRVAGHDLTRAVATGMKVSNEEAEQLKRQYGLTEDSPISFALAPVAESLFREIRLSLEYYQSRNREVRFGDIALIGGNARLVALAEQLQEHLVSSLEGLTDVSELRVYMPTSQGRLEAQTTVKADEDLFPVLAVALGLAMREVDVHGRG